MAKATAERRDQEGNKGDNEESVQRKKERKGFLW